MAILGIDFGSRRLGLAVSDESERIALPLPPMESAGVKKDLVALGSLVRERAVDRIVVGLPLGLDGRSGPQAEAARRFAKALQEGLALPVDLFDERFSSREADLALESTGRRGRKKKKAMIDSVAATVLLRTFLERRAGMRS
jgi:putative Holliday junction resolvase